jgi:TPR repeat protein
VQNSARGYDFVKKASEQNNACGHFFVGLCRELGTGVRRKYSEAARMYDLAVEQGYPPAQSALGKCYYYGIGVEQNEDQAIELFRRSAENNNARGCYYYGMILEFSDTPHEAIAFYQRSADANDPFGQCALGIQLARNREFSDAVRCFLRAADQNDAGGFFNLGCCHVRGEGTEQDIAKGYQCFRKVLELGGLFWEPRRNNGLWYRRSEGLSLIDLSQSWKRAAFAGDLCADVNYRFCQFTGNVVARDVAEAAKAFKAAAEQKHFGGMFCLGLALSEGATKQNEGATKWFAEAALWNQKGAVGLLKSQSRMRRLKPKINIPAPGRRSFLVPGNRYQREKEAKERRNQVKTSHK